MGMGFRLNLKLGFPTQSHFLSNSPSRLSSSPVRGWEASFNSARSSFLSVISEQGETLNKDPLRAYAYSSAAQQTLENDFSEMQEMKTPVGDNKSSHASLQVCKASHFGLLMENLNVLEEMFADSNELNLERKILLQLGRLGALKFFNSCLSRTLKNSNVFDLLDFPIEPMEGHKMNGKMDDREGKLVISSGKKEERKSRRKKASNIANRVSSLSLPSKIIEEHTRQPTVSSAKRASKSRRKRLTIARNEAEMSRVVKVVANLERIRTTLEEETGRVVSLSCWAEAAGVDEKVLQQQLRFGWYCRDELLRSTRSLVLYLARNYRGLGIALEDLLQAGKLGILQGAERFDHTRGYRFSTYVQYWIKKSMSKMVAQHARGIQIPYGLSRIINQIQKARKALRHSRGKNPDDDDIAKSTGLSLYQIGSASRCLRVVGSIDQKLGDYLGVKYMELTPDMSIKSPEETVMRLHMKLNLYNLLRGLDPKERQVLFLRFGLKDHQPKSLEEIGRLFHVSKEWIRKTEKKALTKLRNEETIRNFSHFRDL